MASAPRTGSLAAPRSTANSMTDIAGTLGAMSVRAPRASVVDISGVLRSTAGGGGGRRRSSLTPLVTPRASKADTLLGAALPPSVPSNATHKRAVSVLGLALLCFSCVAGGPFGIEVAVSSAGAFATVMGLAVAGE